MAANITDKLDRVTDSTTGRPVIALLASPGKALAAASITIDDATNWTTESAIHFAIYNTITVAGVTVKDPDSQTDWKGVLTGTTISSLTLTGGSDREYLAGATVELTPTARYAKDIYDLITTFANQDGTFKANVLTAASQITDGIIGNAEMATAVKPVTIADETSADFVASGCIWSGDSYAGSLNASMTAGVVYINGNRVAVSAVTARAFTASRDTYIDVGEDGVVDYNPQTNNAASPALASGHIRIGIVVTGASNIAAATSINQGEESRVLPIASSIPYAVTDSLGNPICNRSPQSTLLGYRQITTSFATTSTTATAITGLSVPVKVPAGRKVKVSMFVESATNSAGSGNVFELWEGAITSGTKLSRNFQDLTGSTDRSAVYLERVYTPTSTSLTFNASLLVGSGTGTANADSTYPAYLKVELV